MWFLGDCKGVGEDWSLYNTSSDSELDVSRYTVFHSTYMPQVSKGNQDLEDFDLFKSVGSPLWDVFVYKVRFCKVLLCIIKVL